MTRVLIVDDEPSIRQVIAYVLHDEGYQVDEASDGRMALDMVDRLHPDIIILDMKMPRMDGQEFARVYRERHNERAHIIVLTASQNPARPSLAANGASYLSFLSKPFDLDTLVAHVAMIAARL